MTGCEPSLYCFATSFEPIIVSKLNQILKNPSQNASSSYFHLIQIFVHSLDITLSQLGRKRWWGRVIFNFEVLTAFGEKLLGTG